MCARVYLHVRVHVMKAIVTQAAPTPHLNGRSGGERFSEADHTHIVSILPQLTGAVLRPVLTAVQTRQAPALVSDAATQVPARVRLAAAHAGTLLQTHAYMSLVNMQI